MLEPVYVLEVYLLCHFILKKEGERERKTHCNSQLVITSSKMHNMKIARTRKKRNWYKYFIWAICIFMSCMYLNSATKVKHYYIKMLILGKKRKAVCYIHVCRVCINVCTLSGDSKINILSWFVPSREKLIQPDNITKFSF